MYPFLTVFFISINRSYNNITLTVQFINFWEISFHQTNLLPVITNICSISVSYTHLTLPTTPYV